jgi:predicted RND superfamily exporter protein
VRFFKLTNLAWPGQVALRHQALAVLFLGLVLVGIVAAMFNLRFESNIYRALSSQNPVLAPYEAFLEETGGKRRQFLLLMERKAGLRPQDYRAIGDFTLEIGLVDHVASTFSITSARFPTTHPSLAGQLVVPNDLGPDDLDKRLSAFEQVPSLPKMLLSSERQAAMILVAMADDAPRGAAQEIYAQITSLQAEGLDGGLLAGVASEELIGASITEALKTDLIVFSLGGGLLASLVAIFLLRNIRLILVCTIPAVLSGGASLIFYPLLGIPITVLNNVIPILVFVLALADSVHLTSRLADNRVDTEAPLRDHIADAIRAVGPACALTALTTAIAFGAISISSDVQFQELAKVGASAVLFGYVVVVVAFPITATFLRPTGQIRHFGANRLAHMVGHITRHARKVIGLALVALVVSAAVLLPIEPWFNLKQNQQINSDLRVAEERIGAYFGGFYRLWIEFDAVGDPNATAAKIADVAGDYPVLSAPLLNQWRGEEINTLFGAGEAFEALDQLFAPEYGRMRALVLVPEPMENRDTLARYDQIEGELEALGATVMGLPAILRHEPAILLWQMTESLLWAVALSCILIAIAFRKAWIALIMVLPNLLPLIITAAAHALLNNWQFGPVAVLSLTIAFGIAVDDSIHFISRYAAARKAGRETEDAIANAVREAGKPMIAASILICAGLVAPLFSQFETVQTFANMQIIALSTAIVCDLVVLPALIFAFTRLSNAKLDRRV